MSLPLPSGEFEKGSPRLSDADTGLPIQGSDVRAEFERLSRLTPHNPQAERAFIESKIELIRRDPNMSDAAKERAIEELRSGKVSEPG